MIPRAAKVERKLLARRGGRAEAGSTRRRRLSGVATVALGLAAFGCAGHRAPVSPPSRPPAADVAQDDDAEGGVLHVVEPGQTLWRIARAYGVPLEELARANGIADPSRVEAGRVLLVPGATHTLEVPPFPAPPPAERSRDAASPTPADTFSWPVPGGRVLSRFGDARRSHRHQGLDIAGTTGERIVAAAAGRVIFSGTMRGYGRTVILQHAGGYRSLYAHGSKLLVSVGDEVRRGQAVAVIGRTGNATGVHCHFEIRKGQVAVDPLLYLPQLAMERP
jgi:murein DD-endopeptidase MepM/ murein hydrolase activator NlpD